MTAREAVLAAAALDAALVGVIILDHRIAADVTEAWCATPRWIEAARVLCGYRGRLGTIFAASAVLAEAGVLFPASTAGEALVAVFEAVPSAVLAAARVRLLRLRAQRVARLLADAAQAPLPILLETLEQHIGPRTAALIAQARGLTEEGLS
jgi:hypothetical protein